MLDCGGPDVRTRRTRCLDGHSVEQAHRHGQREERLTGPDIVRCHGVDPFVDPGLQASAGEATDIADTAFWLASDESTFVTGQAIAVDGGLSAEADARIRGQVVTAHLRRDRW